MIFAAPAWAQDRKVEFGRALDSGQYPAISVLLRDLGGSWGAQAMAYAGASSQNPQVRLQEWSNLDLMLRGGKLDKGGAHIRREMAKLPGDQWGFMALVDQERRKIYKKLGWGPGGNLTQGLTEALHCTAANPRRCYDRTTLLMEAVKGVMERSYPGWKLQEIIANEVTDKVGMSDQAAMLHGGTHHSPCFIYESGGGRVEIMADSWANVMVPAYTWWYSFDKHTHNYIYKAGGRAWCDESLISEAVKTEQAEIQGAEAAQSIRQQQLNQLLTPVSQQPF